MGLRGFSSKISIFLSAGVEMDILYLNFFILFSLR